MGVIKAHEVIKNSLTKDLEAIMPGGVNQNVLLSNFSSWRTGGIARLVLTPQTEEQLSSAKAYFKKHCIPHITIGATSNLLFSDDGLNVPCIQVGNRLSKISIEKETITVLAGAWTPLLSRKAMLASLTGLEHTCGIPGTVGGLIYMNGGSQRKGIGDSVVSVKSIDEYGETITRSHTDCQFSYRHSIFHQNNETIVSAELKLERADCKIKIRRAMLSILKERRLKFPRKLPNCGSVFKSNPATYHDIGSPGAIIERLGLKGLRFGGACISPLHGNFIVNDRCAISSDILTLINKIKSSVFNETGHLMDTEVRFVRSNGEIISADLAEDHH